MKIAQINMVHFGSTGKIMLGIAQTARDRGHEVRTFSSHIYARYAKVDYPELSGHKYFGSKSGNMIYHIADRIFGFNGFLPFDGTRELIRMLKEFRPDVVHLHNLHNCTMYLPALFRYLKRERIKVVWTLHDCWTMTGRCPYFTMAQCDKWTTGCGGCPQIRDTYPAWLDTTRFIWKQKKKWFTGIDSMTFVTPSAWLAELVRQSYLGKYPVQVINNGINLDVFQPREGDFREKHGISKDAFIILGVAFGWEKRKGLDVFLELAKRLDAQYQIVLVGTTDVVDKQLPDNIVSVHRTQNQLELAEIYSQADLLLNPTREDNYPTVNMEAVACGTPVLTFRTGGSPESLSEACGSVVPCGDIDAVEREIRRIASERPYSQTGCLEQAKRFAQEDLFDAYVTLYQTMQ